MSKGFRHPVAFTLESLELPQLVDVSVTALQRQLVSRRSVLTKRGAETGCRRAVGGGGGSGSSSIGLACAPWIVFDAVACALRGCLQGCREVLHALAGI